MITGTMVDEALVDETRRVGILQKMSMFIGRMMVKRSIYARTMVPPREGIVYTRHRLHPPPKESKAVQDEAGPSQPVVEPSQTQPDSQTAPTGGRERAKGRGHREIRRALARIARVLSRFMILVLF